MNAAFAADLPLPSERRRPSLLGLLKWAPLAAALTAIAAFDLGAPLAFNDDWQFAWSVRQLLTGHGLHVVPGLDKPVALPQIVWASLVTVGHPDQRLLRLSVLAFIVLIAYSTYALAFRLGAGPVWAALASAVTVANPLFATNATSFMSDTTYIALLLACALMAQRWSERGLYRWLCIVLIMLCTWQRQIGVILPAALTVSLILGSGRPWRAPERDRLGLSIAWLGAAVAYLTPGLLGINRPSVSVSASTLGNTHGLQPLVYAVPMLGFLLAPFALGLLFSPEGKTGRPARRARQYVALGVASGVVLLGALGGQARDTIFPGNVLTRYGFAPTLSGNKPPLMPILPFLGLEAAALLAFAVLARAAVLRWRLTPRPQVIVLMAFAVSQLLPLLGLQANLYDRYYLPIAALLCPLAAAAVARARWQLAAQAAAVVVLTAGIGFYIVGEQDYQSWQVARDLVARQTYRTVPALEVNAGYEADAVYGFLPALERGGTSRALEQYLAVGPSSPRVILRYASPGHDRAGQAYRSIAPGEIDAVPGP